jgi:hypothetical protein
MVAPKTLKRTDAFPSRHIKMLVPAWSPSGRCALASALSRIARMTRSSTDPRHRYTRVTTPRSAAAKPKERPRVKRDVATIATPTSCKTVRGDDGRRTSTRKPTTRTCRAFAACEPRRRCPLPEIALALIAVDSRPSRATLSAIVGAPRPSLLVPGRGKLGRDCAADCLRQVGGDGARRCRCFDTAPTRSSARAAGRTHETSQIFGTAG